MDTFYPAKKPVVEEKDKRLHELYDSIKEFKDYESKNIPKKIQLKEYPEVKVNEEELKFLDE